MNDLQRTAERCLRDVEFDAVRASGPGGQNVNKVATAVQLRFDVRACRHLDADAKLRLIRRAGRRASSAGIIVIQASRHRSQAGNREDALGRLRELLETSLARPRRRVATRATAASKERRLRAKKVRSEIKQSRRDRAS